MNSKNKNIIKYITSLMRGNYPVWPDKSDSILISDFLDYVSEQNLHSLLYQFTKNSHCWDYFPSEIKTEIEKNANQFIAIEMIQKNELIKFLELSNKYNILPLLIKGTPLAHTHYPLFGTRYRVDTDVLIKKEDIGAIFNIFVEMEYSYKPVDDFINRQLSFSKTGNIKVFFDIHWQINNRPLFYNILNYDELFKTANPVKNISNYANTLSPINALLLACLHRAGKGATDDNEYLLWLYDIHLLISNMSYEDLLNFVFYADHKKIKSVCYNAVIASITYFKTSVPEEIINKLSENQDHEYASRFLIKNAPRFLILDLIKVHGVKNLLSGIIEFLFPPRVYIMKKNNTDTIILLPYLYLKRLIYGFYKMTYK